MKKILLIILFLSSCGVEVANKNFITKHGLRITQQESFVSAGEIELATTEIVNYLSSKIPERYSEKDLYNAYDGNKVSIVKDNFKCLVEDPSPNKEGIVEIICSGIFFGKVVNEIKFSHYNCLGNTAFVHEMLHLTEYSIENKISYDHEDKRLFGYSAGSAEHDINQTITEKICAICNWVSK